MIKRNYLSQFVNHPTGKSIGIHRNRKQEKVKRETYNTMFSVMRSREITERGSASEKGLRKMIAQRRLIIMKFCP